VEQQKEGFWFSPFLLPSLAILVGIYLLGRRLTEATPQASVYRFDPRRISLEGHRPNWLRPSMARSFFRSYLGVSAESFPLLDSTAYKSWLQRLRELPWVAQVSARRLVPNRVRLQIGFRRPLGLVFDGEAGWAFVTKEGRTLPADQELLTKGMTPSPSPATPHSFFSPPLPGAPWVDPVRIRTLPVFYPEGVRAQAPHGMGASKDPGHLNALHKMGLLAEEVSEHFLPRARQIASAFQVPGGIPRLLALSGGPPPPIEGEGAFETSDYYLLMRSSQGRTVWLAYGHPPGSPLSMIPWEEKALVLGKILRDHPGLRGVLAADLRFRRYWKKHLKRPSPSSR